MSALRTRGLMKLSEVIQSNSRCFMPFAVTNLCLSLVYLNGAQNQKSSVILGHKLLNNNAITIIAKNIRIAEATIARGSMLTFMFSSSLQYSSLPA